MADTIYSSEIPVNVQNVVPPPKLPWNIILTFSGLAFLGYLLVKKR